MYANSASREILMSPFNNEFSSPFLENAVYILEYTVLYVYGPLRRTICCVFSLQLNVAKTSGF